jgi:hypothetical protein
MAQARWCSQTKQDVACRVCPRHMHLDRRHLNPLSRVPNRQTGLVWSASVWSQPNKRLYWLKLNLTTCTGSKKQVRRISHGLNRIRNRTQSVGGRRATHTKSWQKYWVEMFSGIEGGWLLNVLNVVLSMQRSNGSVSWKIKVLNCCRRWCYSHGGKHDHIFIILLDEINVNVYGKAGLCN